MKKLFVLLFCVMLIMLLPMTALAIGEGDFDMEGLIGPAVGVGISLLLALALVTGDTILGVFVAIRNKEFDWTILPQYLGTGVLPYVGGLLALAALAYFMPLILPQSAMPLGGLFYTAALTVTGKYVTDLKDKLKLLFGVKLVE